MPKILIMNSQEYDTKFVSNALNTIESDTVIRDLNRSTFFIKKKQHEIITNKSILNSINEEDQSPKFLANQTNTIHKQITEIPSGSSLKIGGETRVEGKYEHETSPFSSYEDQLVYLNRREENNTSNKGFADDEQTINETEFNMSGYTSSLSRPPFGPAAGGSPHRSRQTSCSSSSSNSSKSTTSSINSINNSYNNEKNEESSTSSKRSNRKRNRKHHNKNSNIQNELTKQLLFKNKLEFYKNATNIGINMVRPIEILSSQSRFYWLNITGYTDQISLQKETIAELLTEIDPFNKFSNIVISPHTRLFLILTAPLFMIIVSNVSKQLLDKKPSSLSTVGAADTSFHNFQNNSISKEGTQTNQPTFIYNPGRKESSVSNTYNDKSIENLDLSFNFQPKSLSPKNERSKETNIKYDYKSQSTSSVESESSQNIPIYPSRQRLSMIGINGPDDAPTSGTLIGRYEPKDVSAANEPVSFRPKTPKLITTQYSGKYKQDEY